MKKNWREKEKSSHHLWRMADELPEGENGWGFPDDENFARTVVFTIVVGILVITFLRFPKMTIFKFGLLIQAVIFRFFGKDMKWAATPDVATFIQAAQSRREKLQKKRLIFIRHGESTWNDTFNRSLNPIKFIPRLVYALMMELNLFVTGQCDSWFYDSPLSEGMSLCVLLISFIFSSVYSYFFSKSSFVSLRLLLFEKN